MEKKSPISQKGEGNGSGSSKPAPSFNGSRKWIFRCLAIVLVCGGVLGSMEGVLRLIGFGHSTDFFEKRTFNKTEYWVENPGFLYRFMPKTQARSPRPVLIPVKKGKDTIRVFVLGESAAMGDPEPAFGLAQVLRVLLEERFPNKQFEVINTALTAINAHLILPLARECVDKEPDFLVVYMGNNEVVGPFGPGTVIGNNAPNRTLLNWGLAFKRFRLGQFADQIIHSRFSEPKEDAWGGLAMFENKHVSLKDPRLAGVYERFKTQMTGLATLGRSSGIPVLISTVPCNLKDSAPFASSLPEDLAVDLKTTWQGHFEQGKLLFDARLYSDAYLKLKEAESISLEHADLQFSLGTCLLRLGQAEEAKSHFVLARELDLLRFRADNRINQIIRDLCQGRESFGVYFMDAVKVFADQSEQGLPGQDLFWDHVHLKFTGNYMLARLYAERIAHILTLQGKVSAQDDPPAWSKAETCARSLGLTRWGQYQMTATMLSRLNQVPFTGQSNRAELNVRMAGEIRLLRLEPKAELLDAMSGLYQAAIAEDPDHWMLHDQFAHYSKAIGNKENAASQWKKVLDLIPHHFMARFELGSLLKSSELTASMAEGYLREAIQLRPYIPQVHSELGLCLGRQHRYQESVEAFRRATELNPSDLNAHVNWAIALNSLEKTDEAIGRLDTALSISTNSLSAHLNLARFLVPSKDWDRVRFHLDEVLRLDPDNAEAKEALRKVGSLDP